VLPETLNIVSTASAGHVIDAYHEVVRVLESLGVRVTHVGINLDKWYPNEGRTRYSSYGYEVWDLPRPSGCTTSWWQTQGVFEEAAAALPALNRMVDKLCARHDPSVFLLADDAGLLEVALIRAFKQRRCSVVLLEHGYGHIVASEPDPDLVESVEPAERGEAWLGQVARRARRVPLRLVARVRRARRAATPALPSVGVFGTNGSDLVCTYSGLSAARLVRAGVDQACLRPTGYPYFDQFVRRAQLERPGSHGDRPRAVIISNGSGSFGYLAAAVAFYELALDVAAELQPTHDVVFRLKSGEQPRTFLPAPLLDRMGTIEMVIDNGSSRSIDFLMDFDLAVGGESTVLLEALILGCAPILLDPPAAHARGAVRSPLYGVLKDELQVSRISQPSETSGVCTSSADPSYLRGLQLRLAQRQEWLFHALDGQSGRRVAEAILDASSGAEPEAGGAPGGS